MVDALIKAFAGTPFPITREQAKAMQRYHALLTEANTHMNLTAVVSPDEAVRLHYIDSAAPLFHGYLPQNSRCIDVGTGAGFPGIVLAILRPDCTFLLMDSLKKRIRFLNGAIEDLALSNAQAVHSRAEDAGQNPVYREMFTIALSRAVASMPVLCEYCLPFIKIGGSMIAYKGPGAAAQAQAANRAMHQLGAGKINVVDALTPERNHKLVRIRKTHPTPSAYPRKAGLPAKQPL